MQGRNLGRCSKARYLNLAASPQIFTLCSLRRMDVPINSNRIYFCNKQDERPYILMPILVIIVILSSYWRVMIWIKVCPLNTISPFSILKITSREPVAIQFHKQNGSRCYLQARPAACMTRRAAVSCTNKLHNTCSGSRAPLATARSIAFFCSRVIQVYW